MTTNSGRAPRLAPELRRMQLLDAALDLLSESGFEALNVEAVARRAGVTRPVIYDVFGDLGGLLVALIEREEQNALVPLLQIVGSDPGTDDADAFVVQAFRAFLEAVRANPRTWRLVLMSPQGSSPALRTRISRSRLLLAERIEGLIERVVALRGGPQGLDHALLARLIVAMGEDAARLMLAHPRRFPADRLAGAIPPILALVPAHARGQGAQAPALAGGVQAPAPVNPATRRSDPAATRRRVPRAERREQLLDVTLELIAQDGFEALSIEAIARRAGVNRVVVYRSFANLQLLLVALLHREDRRTRATLEGLLPSEPLDLPPAALLGRTLAHFLDAVIAHPRTWRVALLRPESAPLQLQRLVNRRRADLARRLEPLVEWGLRARGAGADGLDVELLARLLLTVGEEQGRLALDDPAFAPSRLLDSSWALLDLLAAG